MHFSLVGLTAMIAIGLAMPTIAASGTAPTDTTLAPPEEKKICRGSIETGSLIKKRKTCLTKAQWDATCAVHPTAAEELVLLKEKRPDSAC